MAKEGKVAAEPVPLLEAFEGVPDPRGPSGVRHPLAAILTLTSVAMLSGARSPYAAAQFGRDRGAEFARAPGLTRDVPPCRGTPPHLFEGLDRPAFGAAVRRRARGRAGAGWGAVGFDGKALRGVQGHRVPGAHLLAAYAHEAKVVLDLLPVDAETDEHEAAPELPDLIPVTGKLAAGDAMFCQRDPSRKIGRKGGAGPGP